MTNDEMLANSLETIARVVETWIKWDEDQRALEDLPTHGDTQLVRLPFNPAHSMFHCWLDTLRAARKTALIVDKLRKQAEGKCDGCGKQLDDAFCRSCAALEELAGLRERVARLEEALQFYSLSNHWSVDGRILAESPCCYGRPDCGDTARAALAQTGGGDVK